MIDKWGRKTFGKKTPDLCCGIYDESYLNECIEKATPGLSKIKDVDKCLDEIRGIDEHDLANLDLRKGERKVKFKDRNDEEPETDFLDD
jgi:hypothetical protein